jgi:hypothetical protein
VAAWPAATVNVSMIGAAPSLIFARVAMVVCPYAAAMAR